MHEARIFNTLEHSIFHASLIMYFSNSVKIELVSPFSFVDALTHAVYAHAWLKPFIIVLIARWNKTIVDHLHCVLLIGIYIDHFHVA